MQRGNVHNESGPSALSPEAEILAAARVKESEFFESGFMFQGNHRVAPDSKHSVEETLAQKEEFYGEGNIEAIQGVSRWLFGDTDDPATFTVAPDNLVVYVRPSQFSRAA